MKRKLCLAILLAFLCLALPARRKAPLVGVSAGISRGGSHIVPNTYVDAVRKAGGIPVIMPVLTDSAAVEAVLARLDGVLFTGGDDIHPARYGEAILPGAGVEIEARRDTSDLLYARAALRRHKTVLAICRGAQLRNVALGGSLYQDLPAQVEGVLPHRDTTHMIGVEKGSVLFDLFGSDSLLVNTFHHQAVKDVAPGSRVTARSSDGVVEAFENANVVAVQFHPERMFQADPSWLGLFRYLVDKAR